MTETDLTQPEPEQKEPVAHSFKSLRELVDFVSGKNLPPLSSEDGRVTEALPDTEVELLEGIGHCPQLEAPQRLVDDLETFLAQEAARAA